MMSAEGRPPIFLVLLQVLLLFGGGTAFPQQNTNEAGSRRTINEVPPETSLLPCPSECDCITSPPDSQNQPSHFPFPVTTCSAKNLTTFPEGIPAATRKLDLSINNITSVDPENLKPLRNLQELSLASNLIEELESAFSSLRNLKELTLSRNQLTSFPTTSIPTQVEMLDLQHNRITRLRDRILPQKSKIHALLLGHNLIEEIHDMAFEGLAFLQLLELDGNRLTEVPSALKKLPSLQELNLAHNRLTRIDIPFHQIIPRVTFLQMRGNPLHSILPEAFSHLPNLKKLILSDVKNLTEFPDLSGTSSVEILRIDRCSITFVPPNLCVQSPKLKSLDLKSNHIKELPVLDQCSELRILELSVNEIEDLRERAFQNLTDLHDLHLMHNRMISLTPATFEGLSNLRNLDLSYNNIKEVHPDTFTSTPKLEDLNLGNNFFHEMPTRGLERVIELKTFNNPNLKEFPGPESFPSVRRLVLSYAYHCCPYVALGSPPTKSFIDHSPIEESVLYPTEIGFRNALSELNLTESWPGIVNLSNRAELAADFWETFGTPLVTQTPFEDGVPDEALLAKLGTLRPRDISCIPLPGPFLPCNDLFDWWTLRCGVWIVFLLALMGNGTVVFVQVFARTKMDVPRFLVCHLAISDFFMGVYLGFLAVIDAATLGEFRKFAIQWQLSGACQLAGFLGVLSSELSVFTLTVITLERLYVITHAMHLNKRLSLKHAAYIMMGGWVFALFMAVLPLFGVSDYRKFAVCLPFEIGDGVSLGYVVFLMCVNGVAFTILMSCYVKMYCSIRGSAAWNSNESRIAKNMALLVFTDLLCWAPIAVVSLTAAFGLQLVSLEEAKVFTVFILPLNSCCNPFLYAILTKQFKKDCVLICKAIEESRVTRGIGRCRHSSNFSNRQTAPNTGSLTDKVSKDGQPCICNSGLHPGGEDVNGNAKYRFIPAPERLSRLGPFGRFFSRYIYSNKKECGRQNREDPRMQNVRRYWYNTATQNYPQDAQKHQRHPSVSSDNFSSSRSDSWRVQNRCGIPLRLLEPRRRNSWAVTRKPSQESNLSSSRNDSSATSNSTATWRLSSRSSVSSDANSHSGGGKSSFKRINPSTTLAPGTSAINHITTTAAVNRPNKNLPSSAAGAAAVIASGSSGVANITLLQNTAPMVASAVTSAMISEAEESVVSMAESSSEVQRKGSGGKTVTLTDPMFKLKKKGKKGKRRKRKKRPEADVIIIDDDEASAKIATNRPRLVRQSAFFSEEVIIEPEICPVHGPLNPGTYDDEDESSEMEDEEEEGEEGEVEGNPEPKDEEIADEGVSDEYVSANENSSLLADPILRKPQGQIGIAFVIVPRRLSTISSRDTLSVLSRDEMNDQPNECGCGSLNPSSSSPGPSNPNALLLPANLSGFGRRKMSEQPVQFFVVPASSGLLNSAKWHSMSSVESSNQSNQPTTSSQLQLQAQAQAQQFISSPQTRSHSRSQSPRGFRAMGNKSERMTSMTEAQEESLLEGEESSSEAAKPFGWRDPNERRVSFQLPTTAETINEEDEASGSGSGQTKSSDV